MTYSVTIISARGLPDDTPYPEGSSPVASTGGWWRSSGEHIRSSHTFRSYTRVTGFSFSFDILCRLSSPVDQFLGAFTLASQASSSMYLTFNLDLDGLGRPYLIYLHSSAKDVHYLKFPGFHSARDLGLVAEAEVWISIQVTGSTLRVLINGVLSDLEVPLARELIPTDDFSYDSASLDSFAIKDTIFSVFDGPDVSKLATRSLDVMYLPLKTFSDSPPNTFKVIENSCGSPYYINLEPPWSSLYVRPTSSSPSKLSDMSTFTIEGCFILPATSGWLWGIASRTTYYRDNSIGCGLYYNADTKEIQFKSVVATSGPDTVYLTAPINYQLNQWYTIAFVFVKDRVLLYWDDVRQARVIDKNILQGLIDAEAASDSYLWVHTSVGAFRVSDTARYRGVKPILDKPPYKTEAADPDWQSVVTGLDLSQSPSVDTQGRVRLFPAYSTTRNFYDPMWSTSRAQLGSELVMLGFPQGVDARAVSVSDSNKATFAYAASPATSILTLIPQPDYYEGVLIQSVAILMSLSSYSGYPTNVGYNYMYDGTSTMSGVRFSFSYRTLTRLQGKGLVPFTSLALRF